MRYRIEPQRAADRRPTVVAFWPVGPDGESLVSLASVVATAPAEVPVLVPDDKRGNELQSRLTDEQRAATFLLAPGNDGLAAFLGAAAAGYPRADIALVADPCELPAGWLEALESAVHADDTVAIATAMAVGAPKLSPSEPWPTRPGGLLSDRPRDPEKQTLRNGRLSPGTGWTGLVTPDPVVCLIRRSTLELLDGPDYRFHCPCAVVADLAARAREAGLSCAQAGEPVVIRPAIGHAPCSADELAMLHERHPWLRDALDAQLALDPGPLRHQLLVSRALRRGITVTIDARSLSSSFGGTQTYLVGLVLALARSDEVAVRVVLAADAPVALATTFGSAGVEIVDYELAASGELERTDIAHRPQQVFTPSDLRLLELLGERLVVTQMDLISYRTPQYHASPADWSAYRRSTRLALAAADQIVFFSEHARRDALAEELVPSARTAIAGIGLDELSPAALEGSQRPAALGQDVEFLLMLGADYVHKNRQFAIRLLDELRLRHGFVGKLVLAGRHVEHGSSAELEAMLLEQRPELREHVIDLGPVSEAEKRWLLAAAVAHLAPSLYEGFGLAPLEAAQAGRPCVYAAWTAMAETIDQRAAVIVPWNPTASAEATAPLLVGGPDRDAHLALLSDGLARHTWNAVVPDLVSIYEEAIASPYRASKPRAVAELEREQLLASLHEHAVAVDERSRELESHTKAVDERSRELDAHARAVAGRYNDLQSRVGFGLKLVDSHDGLLTRREQRGLIRIASRRWLKAPLLGPVGLLGSVRPGTKPSSQRDIDSDNAAP